VLHQDFTRIQLLNTCLTTDSLASLRSFPYFYFPIVIVPMLAKRIGLLMIFFLSLVVAVFPMLLRLIVQGLASYNPWPFLLQAPRFVQPLLGLLVFRIG
jgi:hypothetical protein